MASVSMSATFNASAGDVWATIGDFNGAAKYIAAVADSTMEGSGVGAVRTLPLEDGAKVTERLEKLDEGARSLTYAILDSPFPLVDYVSVMTVHDLGSDRCRVDWSSTFESGDAPEQEARALVEGIYGMGFDGIKQLHGG